LGFQIHFFVVVATTLHQEAILSSSNTMRVPFYNNFKTRQTAGFLKPVKHSFFYDRNAKKNGMERKPKELKSSKTCSRVPFFSDFQAPSVVPLLH